MGRIPGPVPQVAVLSPFLQEAPLGRLPEIPGEKGYKRSMPSGMTECKGGGNRQAPMPTMEPGARATPGLLEISAPALPAGTEHRRASEANTGGRLLWESRGARGH